MGLQRHIRRVGLRAKGLWPTWATPPCDRSTSFLASPPWSAGEQSGPSASLLDAASVWRKRVGTFPPTLSQDGSACVARSASSNGFPIANPTEVGRRPDSLPLSTAGARWSAAFPSSGSMERSSRKRRSTTRSERSLHPGRRFLSTAPHPQVGGKVTVSTGWDMFGTHSGRASPRQGERSTSIAGPLPLTGGHGLAERLASCSTPRDGVNPGERRTTPTPRTPPGRGSACGTPAPRPARRRAPRAGARSA